MASIGIDFSEFPFLLRCLFHGRSVFIPVYSHISPVGDRFAHEPFRTEITGETTAQSSPVASSPSRAVQEVLGPGLRKLTGTASRTIHSASSWLICSWQTEGFSAVLPNDFALMKFGFRAPRGPSHLSSTVPRWHCEQEHHVLLRRPGHAESTGQVLTHHRLEYHNQTAHQDV